MEHKILVMFNSVVTAEVFSQVSRREKEGWCWVSCSTAAEIQLRSTREQ